MQNGRVGGAVVSKQKTQTERVIAAARSYRGITAVDFLVPVIDGGTPITRLAARLWDAERDGYSFECIGRRDKCKVWRLLSEPDVERTIDTGAAESTPTPARLSQETRIDGPLSAGQDTLFESTPKPLSPYSEAA
jgi:hypothetical protein